MTREKRSPARGKSESDPEEDVPLIPGLALVGDGDSALPAQITDAAGPWTDLRLEEDWEYDCRIAALGPDLAYAGQFVAEHRDHRRQGYPAVQATTPTRLRMRAQAHELIGGHARGARLDRRLRKMQHFRRGLFHLARQCGAAGCAESRELLAAAIKISAARDLRAYNFVARLIGVRSAGTMAEALDRLRSR